MLAEVINFLGKGIYLHVELINKKIQRVKPGVHRKTYLSYYRTM